ncbi:MAG: HDOD domain-containing protein [Deltaproteobacteria bacterium]|nr:HDOD domain-containing protein [bacterium]MCB9480180.1 HDOD domain-containing protein [Deltaproteobacteria bacterium]MCB9489104.1 HDOD domain-containing protein [Deltaproteobacteria bacterium]
MAGALGFRVNTTNQNSDRYLSHDEIRKVLKHEISRRVRDDDMNVPMLPHIATQVMELSNKPNSTIKEITDLIETDQQISAKVINVANSPVYRGLHEVTNINRAVVTLGLRTVSDLIFSFAVQGRIFRNPMFAERMQQLWEHSVGCAFVASELAKHFQKNKNNAFIYGLLHDIGKPLILDTITTLVKRFPDRIDPSMVQGEALEEVLDEFHCAVGGLISRKWDFPERLTSPIVFHHDPIDKDGAVRGNALLAGVADLFCHRLGVGCEVDAELELEKHPWCRTIGLDPATTKMLEKQIGGEVILYVGSFLEGGGSKP